MRSDVRNLNETYAATPDAVADARSTLADFAAAAGATPDQVEAVRLAASEAITNSVLHAYREATGEVHINAAVVGGELWIVISDDGCGLKPHAGRRGLGLGPGLISQVSDDFAIVGRPSGGTEVRMRFDLPAQSLLAPEPAARPELHFRQRHIGRMRGFSPSMAPV